MLFRASSSNSSTRNHRDVRSDVIRPKIVFYGNCQTDALATIFRSSPAIVAAYDVRYMASFDDPAAGPTTFDEADAAEADVLFEQFDPNPFPFKDRLPATCTRVQFPSIDFNLLWPLTSINPYNDKSAELPWGHFPYGDRIVVDCVKRGMGADEIWQYYQERSAAALPDLDRFEQLERSRLAAREAKCDVRLSEFVFERFASENLFWCVNHPTVPPLREMARRLIDAAGCSGALNAGEIESALATMSPRGPLALINVPVHPAVAEHFDLAWYAAHEGTYGLEGAGLTYEQYFRSMIETSLAVRDAQT